jgi:hypothetical protein
MPAPTIVDKSLFNRPLNINSTQKHSGLGKRPDREDTQVKQDTFGNDGRGIASRWAHRFWHGSRVEGMRATRVMLLIALSSIGLAQSLSPNWEELTGEDFIKAVQQAQGTCILGFGIVEKHGPSGPLGTDLINVRFIVAKEYAIVFPAYYFGQIFEAQHQPGTIAYSSKLQMELLQETVSEMARNGCGKIVIVNGHGGNNGLL